MEIAGKYKEYFYIIRCCEEGDWHLREGGNGSGMISCEHSGSHTCYDYLDVTKLKEVTNEKIIKEIELSDSYKLYEHMGKIKKEE